MPLRLSRSRGFVSLPALGLGPRPFALFGQRQGRAMVKRGRAILKSDELARLVAEFHISNGGRTAAEARGLVILEWLLKGDPGPFIAWAREGVGPDATISAIVANPRAYVLRLIADMLKGDPTLPYHLVIKRRRGRRQLAGPHWRDIVVALVYEKRCASVGSEVAFEETADDLGMSVSSIRRAVTRYNNMRKRSAKSGDK